MQPIEITSDIRDDGDVFRPNVTKDDLSDYRKRLTDKIRKDGPSKIRNLPILTHWQYSADAVDLITGGKLSEYFGIRDRVWMEGDRATIYPMLCNILHACWTGNNQYSLSGTRFLSDSEIYDAYHPESDGRYKSTAHVAAPDGRADSDLTIIKLGDARLGKTIGAAVAETMSLRVEGKCGPTWIVTTTENPMGSNHPCWRSPLKRELCHPCSEVRPVKIGEAAQNEVDQISDELIDRLPGPSVAQAIGSENGPSYDAPVWIVGTAYERTASKIWVESAYLFDGAYLPLRHVRGLLSDTELEIDLPEIEVGREVILPVEWRVLRNLVQ